MRNSIDEWAFVVRRCFLEREFFDPLEIKNFCAANETEECFYVQIG